MSAPVAVPLPKLAETTDVIVVEEWLVAVGDQVAQGDPLMSAETDKITVDVASPVAGTVRALLVGEGDEVRTGEPICELTP